MKLPRALLLVSLAACASPQGPRPFTTDGCSLFPDGPATDGTRWLACCREHDRKYWRGGSRAQRRRADAALRECVAAAGHPETADWMLRGTRVGGSPYLPTPFRWGYGWPYPTGYKESPEAVGALETETKASSTTPHNVGPTSPDRVLPGEPRRLKNFLIPAIEIPLFQLALNGADRLIYGEKDFGSTFASGWRQARGGHWVIDQDEFTVNQIGHPYQGALYYGFARTSGLNFWEGMAYSNVGSFVWETFGETTHPSINDQVASGTAGPLVGEPLFRMANRILEGSEGRPGFWRELGAGLVSPPTALNRLLFGERYTPVLKSRGAPTFSRFQAGAGYSAGAAAPTVQFAEFSMAYGLPGRPGYLYLRPFDYFTFELGGLRSGRTLYANILTRGLMFGKKFGSGDAVDGVWGLYGSYDYLSPQVFRFSTTAASLGTTLQWRMSRAAVLQGTASGGLGYGTAGTSVPQGGTEDFHYGAAPQALLAVRLLLGGRLMLDGAARGYHVNGLGSSRAPGDEYINRLNAAIMVRFFGHHAVGLKYLRTGRDARYHGAGLPPRHQSVEVVGLAYDLLGDPRLGAVPPGRD